MKNSLKSILKKVRSRWHNDLYVKIDECVSLYSGISNTPPPQPMLFLMNLFKSLTGW